jgi:hypothetical protein
MKEWKIKIKKNEKWVELGVFNKMQTQETLKEYLKTDYEIYIIPIKKK